MAVRMRFVHQAIEELRKEDPNTMVTEYFLRKLIKTGEIPSVKVGTYRRLINYDALLAYLEKTEPSQEDLQIVNGIRRIAP